MIKLSQSYIKDALHVDVCPARLKFKYIDKLDEVQDDDTRNAMFFGRYFEWHLLGATRDGVEPVFKQNKVATTKKTEWGATVRDTRPAAEVQLDALIQRTRTVLKNMGLDTSRGEKQAHIVVEDDQGDFEGHIDWITHDFAEPSRQAIYDVKWTATKYDDRYNGWADFDSMQDQKFQAVHYIVLYWLKYGVWAPFYFMVFGKSGWVRVIKVELTQEGLTHWERALENARAKTKKFEASGWEARPEFSKCMQCGFFDRCEKAAKLPKPEVFKI